MYKISKEFTFSASHVLTGLPQTHPCSHLHGHNYVVKLEFSNAVLDATGFVIDYRSLDIIKVWLDANFDHKHINDIVDFNPTAENIAEYIYSHIKSMTQLQNNWMISAVEVSETPKTNCRYEPNTNK